MKKNLLQIILCVSVSLLLFVNEAYAQDLNEKIQNLEKRLSTLEQTVLALNQTINNLNMEINKLNSNINSSVPKETPAISNIPDSSQIKVDLLGQKLRGIDWTFDSLDEFLGFQILASEKSMNDTICVYTVFIEFLAQNMITGADYVENVKAKINYKFESGKWTLINAVAIE